MKRIHVIPRVNRFVPIGVTGCPVNIKDLRAIRETRVKGWRNERDFWTGSRGAAPLAFFWTGENSFSQETGENRGNKEGASCQQRRCVKLSSICEPSSCMAAHSITTIASSRFHSQGRVGCGASDMAMVR